jgi:hypothetical protein
MRLHSMYPPGASISAYARLSQHFQSGISCGQRVSKYRRWVSVRLVWVVGVSSGFLQRRLYLVFCGVWAFGSAVLDI